MLLTAMASQFAPARPAYQDQHTDPSRKQLRKKLGELADLFVPIHTLSLLRVIRPVQMRAINRPAGSMDPLALVLSYESRKLFPIRLPIEVTRAYTRRIADLKSLK